MLLLRTLPRRALPPFAALLLAACPLLTPATIDASSNVGPIYLDANAHDVGPSDSAVGGDATPLGDGGCGTCGDGSLCCPTGLACMGQCVADCRHDAACQGSSFCNPYNGLCLPNGPGDGGVPPACLADGGCSANAVCCPALQPCEGLCVPDCRPAGQCPGVAHCDLQTGLCGP